MGVAAPAGFIYVAEGVGTARGEDGAVLGDGGAARAESDLVSPESSTENLADWSDLGSGPFFRYNRRSKPFSKPGSPGRLPRDAARDASRDTSTKLDGTSPWIESLIRTTRCRFMEPISLARRGRLPAGPVPLKLNGWTDPPEGRTQLVLLILAEDSKLERSESPYYPPFKRGI